MPQILTLHLVNDLGSDSIGGSQSDVPSLWPGTPTPYDFSLTPQAIRPVWIGVSADGVTNQVYPISTSVPTIIGAGWPRVYQGTEIVGNHGDVLVFSEQYQHVLNALSHCCATGVTSNALVLLSSRYDLDPTGPLPPCGVEAIFKLLAILGNPESHTLLYQWGFQLIGSDGDIDNQFNWFETNPLDATTQKLLPWATGFYGLVDSVGHARFLVADDDPTVDPNAVRVGFYAGGTITLNVVVYDPDDEAYFFTQMQTFRLPGTDCEEGSASASGESSSGGGLPPVGFVPNMRMMAVVNGTDQLRGFDLDMNADSTGWVNWGDGSPDEPLDSAGGGEIAPSHVFATPGNYVVQVRIDIPASVGSIQISGFGPNQLNAYEFLVPFPNVHSVNMTSASEMNAFSVVNLPAVNDLTFNFANFTQAGLDQIIAELDDFGPDNGALLVTDQGTGAIPNTSAGPYLDLTTFRGWTITHD